jgi:hypothetical protein
LEIVAKSLVNAAHHGQHARTDADVPADYRGFLIVDYRSEILARGSYRSRAVKIAEDDVAAWATHAAIRAALLDRLPS